MTNFSCFFILHIFHGILCNQCIVLQFFLFQNFRNQQRKFREWSELVEGVQYKSLSIQENIINM